MFSQLENSSTAEILGLRRPLRHREGHALAEIYSGDNAVIEAEAVGWHRHRSIQDRVSNLSWTHRLDRTRIGDDKTVVIAKCRIDCFNSQRGEQDSRRDIRYKAVGGGQPLDSTANNSDEEERHRAGDERRDTNSQRRGASEENSKQKRR